MAVYLYQASFHTTSIASALPYSNDSNDQAIAELPKEIQHLFDTPLTYLGEGNQTYAFLSHDGRYVVKFFKSSPLQLPKWLNSLPQFPILETYRHKLEKRRQFKSDRIFKAYNIAFTLDKQHTEIHYIHLRETHDLHLLARVIDRLGLQHLIDLDKVAFAVQRKGEPLKKRLKKEISEGRWHSAKDQLKQVIEMYIAEYQLGIVDHDHNLMENVGFVDNRPMRIDVGKLALDLSYTSSEVYLPDLDKIVHQRIAKWFKRNFPEHLDEAMETLEPIISCKN